MDILEVLGKWGPQYVIIGLTIIASWKSGALKAIFSKNGKYVTRDCCHDHIDDLKKEITQTKIDLKDHINGVDRKVDLLLQKALK